MRGKNPKFIGIDLAWQSEKNPTAIVVAEGNERICVTAISDPMVGLEQVLSFVDVHSSSNTAVAIDAPLVINNVYGQRECERAISSRFGRYHAGAHTSNLTRYPRAASVRLASELKVRGFVMDSGSEAARHRPGRWFFEVYPHPTHVVLVGLDRIVKYKKGRVAARREGQRRFAGLLQSQLSRGKPMLLEGQEVRDLFMTDPNSLRGRGLKANEDRLDALLCCYLAAHYWYWGSERNELVGSVEDGGTVVPTRSL